MPAERAAAQTAQEMTFNAAIQHALGAEMKRDSRVILFGIGIHHGANFRALAEEFGRERLFQAPIAEQGFTAAALGAALMGYRPVVVIGRGDFLYCAMDSIANEAAKYRYICGGGRFRVPMVIRVNSTGMGGGEGSQHSQSVEATFMHIPGLKIAIPATPADAAGLFRSAVRDDNPVLFFEHRQLKRSKASAPVPLDPDFTVPLGEAAIRRRGRDLTIVTYAYMVQKCLAAAAELAAGGVEAEVIDLRSLLPWDKKTVLDSVARTGRLLVVSEDCKTAGAGAEIAATVAEEGFSSLRAPIRRLCYPDMIVPGTVYGESLFMIDAKEIAAAARGLLGR
ncbi:MAG TPA: transketolase C-terminal domain-containing protein [Candidatus Acidoferrales bacterium]|nr:transketolase C-terminal domain-containing protein [Candidatus Acidoferrales bacterium]